MESESESDVAPCLLGLIDVKNIVVLFIIFLSVTSMLFNTSVLSNFANAVVDGNVTTYGSVLQGVFLVLLYILMISMMDAGVV